MEDLLFLCHRLPYPPDKGDKIRSYHLLRYLSGRYRIFLGTFVDDERDWDFVPKVSEMCCATCIRPLASLSGRFRCLGALFSDAPLTAHYYHDRTMARWIDGILGSKKISVALAYSSGMAGFLEGVEGVRRVMDFVDVDSEKWRQYARGRTGIKGRIYDFEARRLANYERRIAGLFDASILVSDQEKAFFADQSKQVRHKVHSVLNGVDANYWDPAYGDPNPYRNDERALVFVGAMDYWANAQAVTWFATKVWPYIRQASRVARLYIVGSSPSRPVLSLMDADHTITVTGRVPDVRPYLKHAHLAIAPLLIARGIQNKVLEALAMGKVLLATPQAYEGLTEFSGFKGCLTNSAEMMVQSALNWLNFPDPGFNLEARNYVVQRYSWERILENYHAILKGNGKASKVPVIGPPTAETGNEVRRL